MEPITIRWETGYMTINPDAFFPTSTARIRKLLRVVALDFEHQDVIRMQLAGACIKEQPKRAHQLGYPERLREEREQLKKLTAERSGALSAFRKKKREFEAAEATAEKLRQNAEVLRS